MSSDRPAVMILAAGLGTRMGELTRNRPKPLLPVAGRPLIEHALEQCSALPSPQIVVNTHVFPDQVTQSLAGRAICFSHEPVLLDSGGGLKKALKLLNASTAYTLNADAVWIGPHVLSLLADAWDPTQMDALLAVVPKPRAVGRRTPGDFTLQRDRQLTRGGDAVYTGAQILKTDLLHQTQKDIFSLNEIWDIMASRNRLFGVEYGGHWCDVGHPEGISLAEAALQEFGDG